MHSVFDWSQVGVLEYMNLRLEKQPVLYRQFYHSLQHRIGVNRYGDDEQTGEAYVRQTLLPLLFSTKKVPPVFFDVGANQGNYVVALQAIFPKANIYAFEPNAHAFALLQKKVNGAIKPVNIALGNAAGPALLSVYAQDKDTEHGTLHDGVLAEIFKAQHIEQLSIEVDTLDGFCHAHHISNIDFLKIDTEGHELNVLQGATEMLKRDAISVIQFEFNEMNIYARVFLRDFYQCLPNHHFYRIKNGELIVLGPYNIANELFKYQNILAVHQSLINVLPTDTLKTYPLP